MKELNEKLQKAIEESLPKQLGDALQKRFAELEKVEVDYEDINQLYKNQSVDLKNTQKERDSAIKDLAMKNELLVDIDKREHTLAEREIKAEVNELKYKLDESEKRAVEIVGIVQTVFKSPVYRKSYSLSPSTQYAGSDPQTGNSIHTPDGGKFGDVTKTEE